MHDDTLLTIPDLRAGDIAACYGVGTQARVIQTMTASLFPPWRLCFPPSHVAIIADYEKAETGRAWFESTTMTTHTCIVRHANVDGAQAHEIKTRVDDYRSLGGHVDVYRPVIWRTLTNGQPARLTRRLLEIIDAEVKYDVAGALWASRVARLLGWFRIPDVDKEYCNELVGFALQDLGLMNNANPQAFNPGSLLRRLVRSGVYTHAGTLVG